MNSPLKWHGGKHYLAGKLWDIAQPILKDVAHCFEGYAGSCAWTLEGLSRGLDKSFAINDIHEELTCFWRVLQDEELFASFHRRCEATPFSQIEWDDTRPTECNPSNMDPVLRAWKFFVRCRQSMAGRMTHFSPLSRNRTRRGMNEQASAWIAAIDGLPEVHKHLRTVAILHEPAIELCMKQDGAKTLQYLDPPYVHESRASTKVYDHEMTKLDHVALVVMIRRMKSKIMLSGYPNDVYDEYLKDWTRHEFEISNHAASGESKRRMVECVWTNF